MTTNKKEKQIQIQTKTQTKQYIKDIQTYNEILQNKNYKMKKIIQNFKKKIQIYSKQEDTIKNILILFRKKYHKNYTKIMNTYFLDLEKRQAGGHVYHFK